MASGVIEKTLGINYNLDYLVIVPSRNIELFDAFSFTFGNTISFNNTIEDVEFFVDFLKKNLIGQLIFVDYYGEYDEIINTLVDEHKIKFIFTGGLGELSEKNKLNEFNQICEKYDSGVIDEIGFLDYGLYKSIRNRRRNVKYIMLDLPRGEKQVANNGSNTVGILNCADSDYDSFYNELGSFSFLPNYEAKIAEKTKTVMDFADRYSVKIKIVQDRAEVFCENICNLDINFANGNAVTFIRSMDLGIPCIVGNNDFLTEDYPVMRRYLVVESDDDMDEIAGKIKGLDEEKIFKEYEKFRAKYSRKTKKIAEEFLGLNVENYREVEYDKLLTVLVPVYNTEKYLAECLNSVIAAKISDMEILVVDDGSIDGSDKIIKGYVKEYPGLVRCIKQKNRGLGNVRNVGLHEAKGKYIASVDSDDTIHPRMLKEALPYMKNNIDIVMCDWMSVAKKGSFETPALDYVFGGRKEIEGLLFTTIMPSTCNKIMKKSLFLDNKIEYLEEKYEDLSANPCVLLRAKTIKYIRRPYYNYYLRDNSLMRSKIDPKQMVDALAFLDMKLKAQAGVMDMEEFKYYTYSWRIEEYIINPLYKMSGKELEKAVKYIYDNTYKLIKDIFDSKYYKEMLRGLKSRELCEFIKERNKAFGKRKLNEFLAKNKDLQKLSAGIIYYGD